MRLYLGNLPWRITEQEIEEAFSPYGVQAGSARIIKDHATGKSRGYGFIEVQDGPGAMQTMDGKELAGRPVRVVEALKNNK